MLPKNIKKTEFNNQNIIINNDFADENGNLANLKNPFYRAALEHKVNKINVESISDKSDEQLDLEEDSNKIKIKENKRRNYKDRDPLYYYFIIDGKEYKYACRNKSTKAKYYFYCSDTHCKTSGNFFKESELFEPNLEKHLEYEEHLYIIMDNVKNKFDKDNLVEKDFLDLNKNIIEKTLGLYFNWLIIKINLTPTETKI